MPNRFFAASIVMVSILLAGCGGAAPTEPPEGWERAGPRWWRTGTDTAEVFRDLSSLESMGVGTAAPRGVEQLSGEQLRRALQAELLPLFRHAPQVIDSLFARYVAPDLEGMTVSGREALSELERQAYTEIRRHFREPRRRGPVPITYPDSLRQQGVSGAVRAQVYLNAEGVPQAVRLLEGVHPTLNAIVLRAATQARWEPARLGPRGERRTIPSWVRYVIRFREPPA